MGLFTSLLSSADALQVYGKVFDTIQNNISNANTPGYAKQDQSLSAEAFNPEQALPGGVMAGPLISARSEYLEQSVRDQTQLLGSSEQKARDLVQLQPMFDLTSGTGVSGKLSKFFNSFSQLSVNPNDTGSRQNVINQAGQVVQAFNQAAISVAQVSNNVDSQTRDAVSSINQIAGDLASINQHYQTTPNAAKDAGLDTQLHADLENLSQFANFTVIKTNGSYSVFLGGQTPIVMGAQALKISADFSTPQTVIRDSQGSDITARIMQGNLGAQLQEKNTTLPGYLGSLNTIAQAFADTVNTTLAQGVDQNGNPPATNMFTYTAAAGSAFTLAVNSITPDQIAAALPSAPGGNGNSIALAQLATAPAVNGFTFATAYGNLGSQVGTDISNAKQGQAQQQNLVTQAQAQRSAQSGVSLNEEAAKLLQFQTAYQAVGKLVTVLDGLTQTLMNIIH